MALGPPQDPPDRMGSLGGRLKFWGLTRCVPAKEEEREERGERRKRKERKGEERKRGKEGGAKISRWCLAARRRRC